MNATQNMLMQAVSNAKLPAEGPRVIPWRPDFATADTVELDLSYAVNSTKQISFIQCAYVDNSANTNPVEITDLNTQQSVSVPGGYQGIVPLLSPNPPRYSATSVSPGPVVDIFFLNIPLPPAQWPATGNAFAFSTGGALEVEDVNLLALTLALVDGMAIASGLATAAQGMLYNGTTYDRERGNYSGSAIAAANRAIGTVTADLTNYNGTGISLFVNTTAGAGNVTVKLQAQDPISGNWVDIPNATTAALAGVGTTMLQVHPDVAAVANVAVAAVVPRLLRVSATVAGANITYSVGYQINRN